MLMINLGEHVVRSVVVAVVDVVGGVHLAALAALVTGRLQQQIVSQSYSLQLTLELQTRVREWRRFHNHREGHY